MEIKSRKIKGVAGLETTLIQKLTDETECIVAFHERTNETEHPLKDNLEKAIKTLNNAVSDFLNKHATLR